MAAVSGQNNSYRFALNSDQEDSPLSHMWICTSRSSVKENYMLLCFSIHLDLVARLEFITAYADRLKPLGAHLIVDEGEPLHINVSNYIDARKIADQLTISGELSEGHRFDAEEILVELEKSTHFAAARRETISNAQEELIKELVSPYIDELKEEMAATQTLKNWIQSIASTLKILGPSIREDLPFFLNPPPSPEEIKSERFYDCLFFTAKVYASMGNLESALRQSGSAIPSPAIIERIIIDLVDIPKDT